MSTILPNKINDFVLQLESLPVTKLYKLNSILSDLSNHVYEIAEYVSELLEAESIDQEKKQLIVAEAIVLEKQLISLNKMLYKMGYDDHYLDRALHTLDYTIDDLRKLIAKWN